MSKRQFMFWLWPPYEAKIANDCIRKQQKKITYDDLCGQIKSKMRESISRIDTQDDLLPIAKEIREAEQKRKETIENKASTFIYAIGLSLTIISMIMALLSGQLKVAGYQAITAMITYSVSFVFLLISAYYAVKVRRVRGFHSLCTDKFFTILEKQEDKKEAYIVELLAGSKMNESTLLEMTNYLSVAEGLFLRGLVLLTFASIILVLIKLCQM